MAPASARTRQETSKPARKSPAGRKPLYKAEYAAQAAKLCELGATDADLADFFAVSIRTVDRWKAEIPEFNGAVKDGKGLADERIERALYHRAIGYTHDATKILQHKGRVIRADYREHFPPDTAAAIFWLTNRQGDKWRHKQELTGANGGPIQHIDVTSLTPVEKAQRLAALMAMNGGAGPVIDGKADERENG